MTEKKILDIEKVGNDGSMRGKFTNPNKKEIPSRELNLGIDWV